MGPARKDQGLFALNCSDACYLAFEGTGAVSMWGLETFLDDNADLYLHDLTDVMVRLQYTALQGGVLLVQADRGLRTQLGNRAAKAKKRGT